MRSNTFTRAMVQSLASRSIRRIAEDPERGLRNLVDMGLATATGRFQKHYMMILQGVLEDPACPYYELVCRTARQVENRNLTLFGVNIGWQSWTVGAQRIRKSKAAQGSDIPWSLTLHLAGSPEDGMDWAGLVKAGQEEGIYAYFLHVGGDPAAMEQAVELARGAERSAFLLFAYPEDVAPALGELTALDNTAVMVCTDRPGWQEAVAALREERRLYGLWRSCETAEDVEQTAPWLEEIQDEGGIAAFSIPAPGCPAQSREQLHRLAEETWHKRLYPLLVFDYYADILLVNDTISGSFRFVSVLPDGQAAVYQDGREVPTGVNLRSAPLETLLPHASSL